MNVMMYYVFVSFRIVLFWSLCAKEGVFRVVLLRLFFRRMSVGFCL